MARLTRYTQQLFGTSAGNNQMSEFGSLAGGPPGNLYSGSTITPAIIQTLTNFLEGWFAAANGAYSPPIQDMNSICYLFAYQIAYEMQLGVPEWDAGTTYYAGSFVQDGNGTLYISKTNSNLNHAVTDGTNWQGPPLPGLITPNAVPYSASTTLNANQSMIWPYMQIGNGQTVTVPSNSQLIIIQSVTGSGTGVLQGTGTGVVKGMS